MDRQALRGLLPKQRTDLAKSRRTILQKKSIIVAKRNKISQLRFEIDRLTPRGRVLGLPQVPRKSTAIARDTPRPMLFERAQKGRKITVAAQAASAQGPRGSRA
jgi:hypothetical protein